MAQTYLNKLQQGERDTSLVHFLYLNSCLNEKNLPTGKTLTKQVIRSKSKTSFY